ncbi:SDR family NAD(P)-dependent oxidoreductase [Desulfatitalea alkaliphila]|uniref:SDR family oxidoreductase n=1 Tax=Desulfatitalea alkaliphila TaxID=2929485 RepID=A0AA41R271_9BACT|nr:SDR family oxidoreductase [Desulfatitalea alkaliphila]MCJ8499490.1 SDR family oxidoreductase [Desulfatitalea alkaliphila]
MSIPERKVDPRIQMFAEAIGTAPGRNRLPERNVLVVGAGQRAVTGAEEIPGNGRAIAMLAAREGARVVCADINAQSAAETVARITAEGGWAQPLTVNVAQAEENARMVKQAHHAMGGLDGLVLNVGTSHGRSLDTLTSDIWDREFAVNLRSHMLACQAALPLMAPGSAIVLISSLASQRPNGRNPAYEGTKAAQLALARSVALAGQRQGIRCNAVAPGLIDTPLGRVATQKRPKRAALVPFGRQGTGWEVAYAAIFLLSNEASYINAQSIFVDGGLGTGIAM